MRFRLYQVDAFTDRPLSGNPAAVCPLEAWPEDDVLQAVAAENNLSETAFLVPDGSGYELRWFTPTTEVDLCGHATLAAGYVVLRYAEGTRDSVRFSTASGPLEVRRDGEALLMDFPSVPAEPCPAPAELAEGLGAEPVEVRRARDWLAVFRSRTEVARLAPRMEVLEALEGRGVIATAPAGEGPGQGAGPAAGPPAGAGGAQGEGSSPPGAASGDGAGAPSGGPRRPDFVSRFFAPAVGVPEDPVTGSAHCTLAPYWAERLGKDRLLGHQISRRGGEVTCRVLGDRVELGGRAVLFLEGRARI
jgi:predicted PhzF superfamily epimerase YddE/YHI9